MARVSAGNEAGMPSKADARPCSACLATSHAVTAPATPPWPGSPSVVASRWSWRPVSLSWMDRATSARVNHPASAPIAEWNTTWYSRSPSSLHRSSAPSPVAGS